MKYAIKCQYNLQNVETIYKMSTQYNKFLYMFRLFLAPFSRRKAYFRNGRKIPLRPSEKYWIPRNVLILQFRFHIETGLQVHLIPHSVVLPGTAPWNEFLVNRIVLVN